MCLNKYINNYLIKYILKLFPKGRKIYSYW